MLSAGNDDGGIVPTTQAAIITAWVTTLTMPASLLDARRAYDVFHKRIIRDNDAQADSASPPPRYEAFDRGDETTAAMPTAHRSLG